MNGEECLICKAPLEYLTREETMECAICHKKERSKTRCVQGHYVCSECHTQGMDSIFGLCLAETSTDPVAILRRMMDLPFCHMHGPEHHVMVGAALLTAYKNAGGSLELEPALREMYSRGKEVPGGSEIVLYMGAEKVTEKTTVPNFIGYSVADVNWLANQYGLYIQAKGTDRTDVYVTAAYQDIPEETEVDKGTTITVEFTTGGASD